jgi:hypothetical protein
MGAQVLKGSGFQSVRENSDFGETVEQTLANPAPQGAEYDSPARQCRVEWENGASPEGRH